MAQLEARDRATRGEVRVANFGRSVRYAAPASVALAPEHPAPAAAVTLLRMHYPDVAADREAAVVAARAALGGAAFAAAWAAGQAMPLEQAVAFALEDAPAEA